MFGASFLIDSTLSISSPPIAGSITVILEKPFVKGFPLLSSTLPANEKEERPFGDEPLHDK